MEGKFDAEIKQTHEKMKCLDSEVRSRLFDFEKTMMNELETQLDNNKKAIREELVNKFEKSKNRSYFLYEKMQAFF